MNCLRYQIRHSTVYEYSAPVTGAEHIVRLQPRDLPRQRCLQYELSVDPPSDLKLEHVDYFGNHSALVTHRQSLTRLEITARSVIQSQLPFIPEAAETPAWETVRARVLTDRRSRGLEAIEYSYESGMVNHPPGIQEYAQQSFPPNRPLLAAAKELTERIYQDFKFDPAATTIATPLAEVLEKRRGVCQDFAHLEIACLRSMGLAARYVSGYLETDPPPGGFKLVGADASHAWVAVFCPEIGWIDLDPTNGCLPSLRHITIGWGRDYADVCPIRGVVNGGGTPDLQVAVDVIAVAPTVENSDQASSQVTVSGAEQAQDRTN